MDQFHRPREAAALAVVLAFAIACSSDPTGIESTPTEKGPGREILFLKLSADRPPDLYTINPDGTNLRNLTQDNIVEGWDGDWSPDGSKFVYSSNPDGGDYTLLVRNADGSSPVKLLNTPTKVEEVWPVWSPDGKRIAYTQVTLPYAEIHVVNADGSNPVHLTSGGQERAPHWSPDGTRIAYTLSVPNGKPRVVIMNSDGTAATPVGPEGIGAGPWSPDGKRLLVGKDGDIYSMRPDGSDLVQLTADPKFDGPAAWSPDGKRILFTSQRTGPSLMYTMNADGSDVTAIPGQGANNIALAWRP